MQNPYEQPSRRAGRSQQGEEPVDQWEQQRSSSGSSEPPEDEPEQEDALPPEQDDPMGAEVVDLWEAEDEEDYVVTHANKFWILHACIFRLAFGKVTSGEMVDPSSDIRTTLPTSNGPNMDARVKPHSAPLASAQDDEENNISEIDGKCAVESCLPLKMTSGADNFDVHRLGLAEARRTVFNISSYAWSNARTELCERWVQFLASCISHQVDFIQGDGNLFAQRDVILKKDAHSDFRSCILVYPSGSFRKIPWPNQFAQVSLKPHYFQYCLFDANG
jgi:hypothetical protein